MKWREKAHLYKCGCGSKAAGHKLSGWCCEECDRIEKMNMMYDCDTVRHRKENRERIELLEKHKQNEDNE